MMADEAPVPTGEPPAQDGGAANNTKDARPRRTVGFAEEPTTDAVRHASTSMSSIQGNKDQREDMLRSYRQALSTKLPGVRDKGAAHDREMFEKADIRGIIFPWMKWYQIWWGVTVAAAIFTAFFCPYTIAFERNAGVFNGGAAVIEYLLIGIFVFDIIVNFNRAFRVNEVLVFERAQIAKSYCRKLFWVDFVGVFPFYSVALAIAGEVGEDSNKALLLNLFRLLQLTRLYRIQRFFHHLQYNAHISLMYFTLLRNGLVCLFVSNFAACAMYYLARLEDFDDETWLGPLVNDLTGVERYIISLYWSVTTFTTVGYGDFSPSNAIEQVFGMCFMLLNVLVMAWTIGSITLLIVKGDEATSEYRDALQVLDQYSDMHDFDTDFRKKLKTQLRLEFNNREIADEQVLKNFPSAVRRKILRKLYFPALVKTNLMRGIRQQFVDSFLSACSVEIFTPGEQILERGSISADLFLLVGGLAQTTTYESIVINGKEFIKRQFEAGDFIGEIGFFTESPAVDSVTCLTVCKTLTMSHSAYKLIAQDHPGSVGKILKNLLEKVEELALKLDLPTQIPALRAGSMFEGDFGDSYSGGLSVGGDDTFPMHMDDESQRKAKAVGVQRKKELTAIEDLVRMHRSKLKDDQTTRFLFAASRGDTHTISLMCDQGFDPSSADYDSRTALMVAAVKGNDEVIKMLLEYKADPNIIDVHGSTALYEAVKNGHESSMDLLLKSNATLCTTESYAASVLCQAVSDGDIPFLRRLLSAGIQVDAADYDKRTAAHIAAAEGNVAALKILVDFGADLTLEDRWKNTVDHEAKRSNARQLLEYLNMVRGSP